ncbi:MAG: Isopropylmalate/citramalate isomerase large subunit [Candidatus Syntrophoarchaeum sp. GoM_oil]|nr:MAG: Isopropylmalate/citramalate isomerase large subunit [Candidatus Syntrophoarchaeum sp. GoM_oil]
MVKCMGRTITEKVLKAHVGDGSYEVGGEIGLIIDQCLTQDSTGTMAWLEFEALGLSEVQAKRAVSYCDHTSLGFKGESTDDHYFLQTIASHFGAIYSKPGNGVCHQLHYERFGVPGETLLGADSHTPTCGGLGMIAIGAGGMDVAVAMGGGYFYLTVPEVLGVNLRGSLNWGSSAKDLILTILKQISVKGGLGKVLEYMGDGVKTLSIPERATITNMGAETGATTSIFPSDNVTRLFLQGQKRESDWKELVAGDGALYEDTIDLDLDKITPQVAMPGMPDNVYPVEEVSGTPIDQVFIGSCTNGGYADIKKAALILEDKKVDPSIELIVSPGSRQVLQMLIHDGSVEKLVKSGARVIDPGCNACIGIGFVPGHGHLSLRTVNRNWAGRGGSKFGRIALSGVELAAASAINGEIADPRELDPVKVDMIDYIVDDLLMLKPQGEKVEIRRSPNIAPLKRQEPLPEKLEGEVLIKVADGISTDDILPAGPSTQHLRSNLPEISKFVFVYEDEGFYARCREKEGGFIAGGENYGQGSSREHAALAPFELEIKAVFAKSFARIHHANLINVGIIPFVCDTDGIKKGDRLTIDVKDLRGGLAVKIGDSKEIPVTHNLSERDIAILKAGGLLAYTKAGSGR